MKRTERARIALDALRTVIPRPETELVYESPFQLIVAVILSAQCTDVRVNLTTPALFEAFPSLEALAEAEPEQVYPLIRSISYPNNKAKHLVGMARMVRDEYGGAVPSSINDLMRLPGVGRKTAQVVASVAYDVAALAVDTHVFRVANRIGLVQSADTPLKVEFGLKRIIPEAEWDEAHHLLILHGRYTCTARNPACNRCPVAPVCLYYERLMKLPAPLEGLDVKQGRYYCRRRNHYFDESVSRPDRSGIAQAACPLCGSTDIYQSRTGRSMQQVPDYRVR